MGQGTASPRRQPECHPYQKIYRESARYGSGRYLNSSDILSRFSGRPAFAGGLFRFASDRAGVKGFTPAPPARFLIATGPYPKKLSFFIEPMAILGQGTAPSRGIPPLG